MALKEKRSARETALSRRDMLRRGAVAAGGAAVASFCACPVRAQSKISQAEAEYQDEPNGDQRCETCMPFEAPTACQIVEGPVSPAGWCKYFQPLE